MTLDPTTPVIVGVGQVVARPDRSDRTDGRPLVDRAEPIELMVDAVEAAVEDAGGVLAGRRATRGRRLAERVQSVRVVNPTSWNYPNPAEAVARGAGLDPAELVVTVFGGDSPQSLVNATALAIGRGELDVALLVGADCGYTQAAARRHPDRPTLPWTVQIPDTPKPVSFGTDRRGTTDAEEERGLDRAVHIFPLFEHAIRSERGRSPDAYRRDIGALWSQLSEVAAWNPFAWLTEPMTVDEIITPSETNRLVAEPYTKLLTANDQVDQGAAILLCSVAEAEAAGISKDRWVFPLAGARADDHWFLSHRLDFHSSPAIRLAGRAVFGAAGTSIDDTAYVDLYSCFPAAVEIAAAELGLPTDDRARPLTVTGGMTFAGGPGSNYSTHALATLVGRLRRDPGSIGLVTSFGFSLTRHALGLYSTEPAAAGRSDPGGQALGPGVEVEEAAGFVVADPQVAVGALPQCAPDADASGEVSVETYSVAYDRSGSPERGVVACRTPDGRRAWANVTDPDQLALLVTEEGCDRLGTLRADGEVDLA